MNDNVQVPEIFNFDFYEESLKKPWNENNG